MIEQIIIQRMWALYNCDEENPYYKEQTDYKRDLIIKIKQLQAIVKKK